MSSSRIIKSGQLPDIQSFSFGIIASEQVVASVEPAGNGFVPLMLGSSDPWRDPCEPVAEEVVEAPLNLEGMVVLAEDDLQRKVDEVFQNGVEEGRRQAERGLANVFKSLRDGVAAITGLRDTVLRESEEDLLKLSIMIARKIIQQEIGQDPKILANVIAAAVGGCSELDRVVIRLNPEDYSVVTENRQFHLAGIGNDAHITFTPDDAILSGGCLVETSTGTVDARIEAQLEEIYRSFVEERLLPEEISAPLMVEERLPTDA